MALVKVIDILERGPSKVSLLASIKCQERNGTMLKGRSMLHCQLRLKVDIRCLSKVAQSMHRRRHFGRKVNTSIAAVWYEVEFRDCRAISCLHHALPDYQVMLPKSFQMYQKNMAIIYLLYK